MRLRLQIAAIFLAVGLGALTVTLLRDPRTLLPCPPIGSWIVERLFVLASLAALGMTLVVGILDDRSDDDTDGALDRATFWRAVGLVFLVSALASATFVAVSALVDYLDRVTA
jgi:hypothetical protein